MVVFGSKNTPDSARIWLISMIEDKIRKCLRKRDMTIGEVSKELKISRATASKYLLVLQTKNSVRCRQIGKAKLFSLK